jgi:hypothetical protein
MFSILLLIIIVIYYLIHNQPKGDIMDKQKPIEIASVWRNETRDGEEYWSGYLGNSKLLIFKNKYKKEDRHPDLRVYVAPKEKKKEEGQQQSHSYSENEIPF